jgi:alpha-glucuronidase
MMIRMREAVADWMTLLKLHHIMVYSHHHGPGAWGSVIGARAD